MKAIQGAIVKDLVLIGGGHSHVAVLRSFGMKPMPGVRLTLIARDVNTPYSGMLPGYVAGHYSFDQAHIDLRPLCRFASARLYHDSAVNIDTRSKRVICANRPPVAYDLLSINIGSRPGINSVPGAAEFTTPVKPINRFVDRWQQLLTRVLSQPGPHRIAVVGAGAAGVEILLAIQYRLQMELARQQRNDEELEFHLVSKSRQIMPTFPAGAAERFNRILRARQVQVHRNAEATRVHEGKMDLSTGKTIELDEILWVTGAGAQPWLKESGLDVDTLGFIRAKDTLQSTSHADIFAAGDIVHVVNHPRPKAGVFAVRQGKPLTRNLRRALIGKPPKPFAPQKTLLALVSTGDKYAVASKAGIHFEGKKVWDWKDWIDRRFMAKFTDLPKMAQIANHGVDPGLATRQISGMIATDSMRCGGCGAKVGAKILRRALANLPPLPRDDILVGLDKPDDAAVIEIPANKVMVQSVDYIRSFIDDPYLFGQIAANHALSDIFAMGAAAQSAQAIATLPFGLEQKVENTLHELMAGAIQVLNDANTTLVGGHTSEGAELAMGFAVNGLADRTRVLRKSGMQPGDQLVLTKPLGTGTLFAADMRRQAKGRWITAALASMLQSNRKAASDLHAHGATACTDVTGFGLIGHLLEMANSSTVAVEIEMASLPLIDGAAETMQMGILSTLHSANQEQQREILDYGRAEKNPHYPILFDPQTSGGLLASIPANRVESCLLALHKSGYDHARVIGRVKAKNEQVEPIALAV